MTSTSDSHSSHSSDVVDIATAGGNHDTWIRDAENPQTIPCCESRYCCATPDHQVIRQTLVEGPPIPVHYVATKPPTDTVKAIYKVAQYKASLPYNLLCVQSFMAGFLIAMGGHLFLAVGGGVLGAVLFPVALIAVILTSAELFTGDAIVFTMAVLGRQVAVSKLFRNWTVSWIGNFIGTFTWAGLIAYASDALAPQRDFVVLFATQKASQTWIQVFLKGIGANFLVCLGVWQTTRAEDVVGKIFAMWFPIMAFVAMELEHSIADQFLLPVGMMYGADISISTMLFRVILPATIGNIVGGGFLMGAVYWYVFDSATDSWNPFGRVQNVSTRSPSHNSSNKLRHSMAQTRDKYEVQMDLESRNEKASITHSIEP